MNELHQHTFVLVNITLGLLVERVVTGGEDEIFQGELWKVHSQMLVNLTCISVLPQQSPEYPLSSHPLHLCRHTSLSSTLSLTGTSVPSLPLGS